ncbi:ribosomal RNA large subunit methyltransferase j [Tribonema minus]|uniref:rRNA methyltransferase 2, mitochondrial n=1 Tax=Tribonema minus TaxID=303371 RepID=A0A835ZAB4_9STRA|nr:ribosomal RNA large subunit methyltransferase j [Tribonema minus]
MQRHVSDPYVQRAVAGGLRSRAAFKLQELQSKHRLLRPGARVVDLGAAPGGWSVVAAGIIGEKGQLVAVDLLPMDPLSGNSLVIQGDFTHEQVQVQVRGALRGGAADVVLSDMAPNFCGDKETDHLRCISLCEEALSFALRSLRPGGMFCCKLLKGREEGSLRSAAAEHFESAKFIKPRASRDSSAELYLLATGLRSPRQ